MDATTTTTKSNNKKKIWDYLLLHRFYGKIEKKIDWDVSVLNNISKTLATREKCLQIRKMFR